MSWWLFRRYKYQNSQLNSVEVWICNFSSSFASWARLWAELISLKIKLGQRRMVLKYYLIPLGYTRTKWTLANWIIFFLTSFKFTTFRIWSNSCVFFIRNTYDEKPVDTSHNCNNNNVKKKKTGKRNLLPTWKILFK